jgi:nucleoside-diphosphate-sugar epimerase
MSPEARTALVTGATGFIGGHVVHALLAAGWGVRALVRATSDTEALRAQGVVCVVGDMGDPSSLAPAVSGCAVVLHLASLLKVPWRAEFAAVNVAGTANVAAACAAAHPRPVLVVMSSLAAVGPAPGAARRETDAPAPVSIYGRVKAAAEQAAVAHAGTLELSIVRSPMVFGEGDRGALPLFRSAARGLHIVPTRTPARVGLVHAADLAQALLCIAQRGERVASVAPAMGVGVYHVAHDDAGVGFDGLGELIGVAVARGVRVIRLPRVLTWAVACLAEGLARIRRRPAAFSRDKYREAVAGDWVCDSSKIRALGFEPGASLEARLAQTARWYRAEGWL